MHAVSSSQHPVGREREREVRHSPGVQGWTVSSPLEFTVRLAVQSQQEKT